MPHLSGTVPQNTPNNPDSPWWSDAQRDPWRDPNTPAVLVSHPSAAGPELELPPTESPAAVRGGVGLICTIAVIAALLAGVLGGTLGYVFAARNGVSGGLVGLADDRPAPLTNKPPESLAGVVQKVLPSLVTIRAQDTREQRTGSGFIITPDGYIVTNEHVVAVGSDGTYSVSFDDASQVSAVLVGRHVESDIAVLKVDRSGLTPVTFGDSEQIAVGDPVLALGTPFGQEKTVTYGIVSALNRARPAGESQSGPASYFAAIQTDAAINHGNSGGPLVDAGGRVIGVNEQIITGSKDDNASSAGNVGIGFAVPINQARRVASEIMTTGSARRTVMGASLDQQYQGQGARLVNAVAGGPAAQTGLRPGDVITVFNGHVVEDDPDLIAQISKLDAGTVVSLEYRRDGQKHTAQITLTSDK